MRGDPIKSILKYLGIRILIGLVISAVGVAIGLLRHNMNLFYDWFGMGSLGLVVISGFMMSPGARIGTFKENWAVGNDTTETQKQLFDKNLSASITLISIGLTIFITAILYYLIASKA